MTSLFGTLFGAKLKANSNPKKSNFVIIIK